MLAASGLIAGEGIMGVAIALAVAARKTWPDSRISAALARLHFAEGGFTWLGGAAGALVGVAIVAAVCALLFRAGSADDPALEGSGA